MIGISLGPYKILEPLGAGGMGQVYLAEDSRLGRKVAIKVLPEEFASDPERLARFEQQARAAAALNHPHIAVLHDIGYEKRPGGSDEAAEAKTDRASISAHTSRERRSLHGAGVGDEIVVAGLATAHPREAAGEDAAVQVTVDRLLCAGRQRSTLRRVTILTGAVIPNGAMVGG